MFDTLKKWLGISQESQVATGRHVATVEQPTSPYEEPESIPVHDGNAEDLVVALLEEAARKAEPLSKGQELYVDAKLPGDIHYMELVGPVMVRALDYGLVPGICFNGRFEFTKM